MANIKLNNVEYQISDSTLSAPTADFIAHLQTIAGEGLRVVVGGVEYNVDPNKVAGAIADLERVFDGLKVIEPYLTFSSPNSFTLSTGRDKKYWDGTLEYSTDTETWNTWDGTTISADDGVLYMRGTGNTYITGDGWYGSRWVLMGSDISCDGNIENLLDYETVQRGEHPQMADKCFCELFEDCESLIKAPQLPAVELTKECYSYMFSYCTNLVEAPQLPATTLADHCYDYMFGNCTSLTTAPELPATELAEYCYYCMFSECFALVNIPKLPATTMVKDCYTCMFEHCTSLVTPPELPSTTLADECYQLMFRNCASLTALPELPATELATYCYESMFLNCTGIKLSETKTDEYQVEYRIPTSGIGTDAAEALTDMFKGTGGNFTGTPSINTVYYTSNAVV